MWKKRLLKKNSKYQQNVAIGKRKVRVRVCVCVCVCVKMVLRLKSGVLKLMDSKIFKHD